MDEFVHDGCDAFVRTGEALGVGVLAEGLVEMWVVAVKAG